MAVCALVSCASRLATFGPSGWTSRGSGKGKRVSRNRGKSRATSAGARTCALFMTACGILIERCSGKSPRVFYYERHGKGEDIISRDAHPIGAAERRKIVATAEGRGCGSIKP